MDQFDPLFPDQVLDSPEDHSPELEATTARTEQRDLLIDFGMGDYSLCPATQANEKLRAPLASSEDISDDLSSSAASWSELTEPPYVGAPSDVISPPDVTACGTPDVIACRPRDVSRLREEAGWDGEEEEAYAEPEIKMAEEEDERMDDKGDGGPLFTTEEMTNSSRSDDGQPMSAAFDDDTAWSTVVNPPAQCENVPRATVTASLDDDVVPSADVGVLCGVMPGRVWQERVEDVGQQLVDPSTGDAVSQSVTSVVVPDIVQTSTQHDHAASLGTAVHFDDSGEAKQLRPGEATLDLLSSMDPEEVKHSGATCSVAIDDQLSDLFGLSAPTSSSTDTCDAGKEKSPDIVVDCLDCAENLKDASSEKASLSGGDAYEDKRASVTDQDIDFQVLELDSSHLNLDLSKQKSSLRKKGSLARRKKPTRGVVSTCPADMVDTQDMTDSGLSQSADTEMAPEVTAEESSAPSQLQLDMSSIDTAEGSRKPTVLPGSALIMPGLLDLSQSRLFAKERSRSDDSPTSPLKSSAPTAQPPAVSPKPASKGQKESQNLSIAQESAGDVFVDFDGDSGKIAIDSYAGENMISGAWHSQSEGWSSVSGPGKLSRGDSVSSVDGGDASSMSSPRRPSIQGSAYNPVGFRPRRSSSVLDTGVAPPSPSPAPSSPSLFSASAASPTFSSPSPFATTGPFPSSSTTTTPAEESKEPSSPVSFGARSSLYKAPAWLSEMKAKTGSSDPRTSGSDDNAVSSPSPISRSRNTSGSAGSVDVSPAPSEGAAQRSIVDEVNLKRQEKLRELENKEKPLWMKTAAEKTSRAADSINIRKEESAQEEKMQLPPWAAELKMKNKAWPLAGSDSTEATAANGTPHDQPPTAPILAAGRAEYTPSWMKMGHNPKKNPLPAPGPRPSVKPVANGKEVTSVTSKGNSASENPMKAYETPKWKLDIAEKKKRRETELQSVGENEVLDESSLRQQDDRTTHSHLPQWKQQLSLRRRTTEITQNLEEHRSTAVPEWAKKTEERRARLIKSGLFDPASPSTDI